MAVDLIDFINSLRRPGGGDLGERGAAQIRYPAFLPLATVSQILAPRASHFAAFGYKISVGREVIPNAFTVSVSYSGGGIYAGVLTKAAIEDGFRNFILLTHVNPLIISATNTTGLFQYMEVILSYFTIPTKDDLNFIYGALSELAMTGHNKLLTTTNALLQDISMTLKRSTPPPLPTVGRT